MGDQILIRMDPALKEQLAKVAKMEGKTSSEVIRALVEDYLRQRDVGAYVDSLWDRLGKDFKARKLTARDVTAGRQGQPESPQGKCGSSLTPTFWSHRSSAAIPGRSSISEDRPGRSGRRQIL